MSYTTAEAALLTLVRAYEGGAVFTAANSSRGDFSATDAPGYRQYAVVMMAGESDYGDALFGRGAHGKRQQRHRMSVLLFQARQQGLGGDGAAYSALLTLTDGVAAWLERYPRLDGASGVKRAEIVRIGKVRTTQTPAGAPGPHLLQPILLDVLCETEPAQAESAQA